MHKELYLFIICCLLFHVIFAGTLTLVSDTTLYTIQSSRKVYAVTVSSPPYYWASINGASWIWQSATNTIIGTALFIKCFDVPGIPTYSYITIAADDDFTLFLNGRLVDMKSETYKFLTEINMLSKTVQGNNCLHIIVENKTGYGGLLFQATIKY